MGAVVKKVRKEEIPNEELKFQQKQADESQRVIEKPGNDIPSN